MSLNQSIASAVSTGKCKIGARAVLDAIRNGEARLVVVAANCPKNQYEDIMHYAALGSVKVYEFGGTSWDLGEIAGKPFMVSAIAVIEPGDSQILSIV